MSISISFFHLYLYLYLYLQCNFVSNKKKMRWEGNEHMRKGEADMDKARGAELRNLWRRTSCAWEGTGHRQEEWVSQGTRDEGGETQTSGFRTMAIDGSLKEGTRKVCSPSVTEQCNFVSIMSRNNNSNFRFSYQFHAAQFDNPCFVVRELSFSKKHFNTWDPCLIKSA